LCTQNSKYAGIEYPYSFIPEKKKKAGVSAPIDAYSYGLTKQNEICWMFKTM
jgi:hypothetical protein